MTGVIVRATKMATGWLATNEVSDDYSRGMEHMLRIINYVWHRHRHYNMHRLQWEQRTLVAIAVENLRMQEESALNREAEWQRRHQVLTQELADAKAALAKEKLDNSHRIQALKASQSKQKQLKSQMNQLSTAARTALAGTPSKPAKSRGTRFRQK